MVTTDNCWAHTGWSLPFAPSFARCFHVPLALNNIKRYQALSLAHIFQHFKYIKVHLEAKERSRGGWWSVRATVSQSPGPFLIYLTDNGGPAVKKRPLLLFQSFHRLLLKMRCVQCALLSYITKVEILVSDKNKMSTNRAEFVLFDWLQVAGYNTHAHAQYINTKRMKNHHRSTLQRTPSQLKTNSKKFVQIINNIINFQP